MSHEIEIFADAVAFFSARQPAWHGLGTVTDGALTAEDALKVAHLASWNLRKVPDVALVEDNMVPVEGFSRVIRDNPFVEGKIDVLGHVSENYGLVSNETAFAFLDAFKDLGGAKFETAGSINNGRRVFVTMEMPNETSVAGGDRIQMYTLITTSHDGTAPVEALITPVRVVCQNTLNMALRNHVRRVKVRHTAKVNERLAEAARVLGAVGEYEAAFVAACDRLAAKKMGSAEVEEFLAALFPIKDEPGIPQQVITRATNKREEVKALIQFSPNIDDSLRNTAYGAWQGYTEWKDWASPANGSESDKTIRRAIRNNLDDMGSDATTKAYNILVGI